MATLLPFAAVVLFAVGCSQYSVGRDRDEPEPDAFPPDGSRPDATRAPATCAVTRVGHSESECAAAPIVFSDAEDAYVLLLRTAEGASGCSDFGFDAYRLEGPGAEPVPVSLTASDVFPTSRALRGGGAVVLRDRQPEVGSRVAIAHGSRERGVTVETVGELPQGFGAREMDELSDNGVVVAGEQMLMNAEGAQIGSRATAYRFDRHGVRAELLPEPVPYWSRWLAVAARPIGGDIMLVGRAIDAIEGTYYLVQHLAPRVDSGAALPLQAVGDYGTAYAYGDGARLFIITSAEDGGSLRQQVGADGTVDTAERLPAPDGVGVAVYHEALPTGDGHAILGGYGYDSPFDETKAEGSGKAFLVGVDASGGIEFTREVDGRVSALVAVTPNRILVVLGVGERPGDLFPYRREVFWIHPDGRCAE